MRIKTDSTVRRLIEDWDTFNTFWLSKVHEFRALPKKKRDTLASSLELPLSLAIKHYIAFLEAQDLSGWKLGRLSNILSVHTDYPDADVETSLFLLTREVQKYYSKWDFINCKY